MEVNIAEIKDGDSTHLPLVKTPSIVDKPNPAPNNLKAPDTKKKRRRGKSKRKIMKPYTKIPWQDRRKNDKTKRNNRFRKIVLAKTHAPFNNNQFLMEIHKPEPENNFALQTPSARTRDSSFSMDSEENYFYSLPEDEEDYLTKEFSSVYEDAQSERLASMTKNDLIQEYLLLEAKYDNLVKRTERVRPRYMEEDRDAIAMEKDVSLTDRDSMVTDKDTSATSVGSSAGDTSLDEVMLKLKEQEDQIRELQLANEKLRLENESLRKSAQDSSSEDSESDSSSTSVSSSSSCSSRSMSPVAEVVPETNGEIPTENDNSPNGEVEEVETLYSATVNGFHSPGE